MTNRLQQLRDALESEKASRAFLRGLRWPNGFKCPLCNHQEGRETWGGRFWTCAAPRCHFRTCIRVGTFLEGSRKPIRLWLKALHIFVESKHGLTASGLCAAMDEQISYPTAWAWLQKFRLSFHRDPFLRRSLPKSRSLASRQKAPAWSGSREGRSAISMLRAEAAPARARSQKITSWLLAVFRARVSSKHLGGYWLEFHFRESPSRASRLHRLLDCLGTAPPLQGRYIASHHSSLIGLHP